MNENKQTDQLDMQSTDIVADNVQKIAALFPNCVTEGEKGKVIDFDLLKQELSADLVEGNKERYRLEWPGKKEAIVTANIPTTKTLRPIREDSVDFDNTQNIYIEGDNLEVLKILQESYLNKIKMIYIDPPYNTGNDFVYKDNFRQNTDDYKDESGQVDDLKNRLQANPETAGRYHSNWLSMMYPRLKLARNLLKNDGLIFISIDDNEYHNLKSISDELFGEVNFITSIVWEKRFTRSNNAKRFYSLTENILCYRRSEVLEIIKEPRSKKANSNYSNPDNDPRGSWTTSSYVNPASKEERPNLVYTIENPFTGEEIQHPTNAWKYEYEKYLIHKRENKLHWGMKSENKFPRLKLFLSEMKNGMVPVNLWKREDVGTTDAAGQALEKLFDAKVFDFPKPIGLIRKAMSLCCKEGDIVLDFFSGSGTLAEAVIESNSELNLNLKYILVQIPEQFEKIKPAYKSGYKNICEIGKERIRRAAKKIKDDLTSQLLQQKGKLEKMISRDLVQDADKWLMPEGVIVDEKAQNMLVEINDIQLKIKDLDFGFRVYRLDESNMQDVYYTPQEYEQKTLELFADNVKPDRSGEDLLAQVILDWGLPLSLKIEQANIEGKQVFKVAGNSLYACFDTGVGEDFAKTIAKEQPLRMVFKDSSFKDDTAKSNVKQLLKQLSPETEMRVI